MRQLSVVIILVILQSCATKYKTQFDFSYEFGVGSKNELNTFNNTFTKDMVVDSSITIALKLSAEEKQRVYNKLKEINFMDIPDNDIYGCPHGIPFSICQMIVNMDGITKKVTWESSGVSIPGAPVSICSHLTELDSMLIVGIIHNREEFKRSKVPRAGYL